MQRTAVILALTLASGIAVGMSGHHVLHAQPAAATRTGLLTTELAGVEGKEVVRVASTAVCPTERYAAVGSHTPTPWHAQAC
jgi:hypothetical protein